MAKIKCSECGTKFEGNFCPKCSAPAPEGPQKKKNKWLLPAIAAVVLICIVAGCSGNDTKQPSDVQGDSSVQGSTAGSEETTQATEATTKSVTIAETELYNANGVTVTATKISDGLFGPEIAVTVSNDSDKNVTVSTRELSVNGYMLSTSGLYSSVAAGKKAVESLTLLSSELSEAGIDTVANIEFYLNISDSDTYMDIGNSDLITLSTSAAEGFTQPVDDSGDVIYDANGIRVVCKGLKDDIIWDGCVVFYFENNSNSSVSIYSENVSVNGYMVTETLWADLRSGTKSIDAMYMLTLSELGLENIDQVENIEFNLCIIDENWNTVDSTDIISLKFGQ